MFKGERKGKEFGGIHLGQRMVSMVVEPVIKEIEHKEKGKFKRNKVRRLVCSSFYFPSNLSLLTKNTKTKPPEHNLVKPCMLETWNF